ncbi:outer membrane protein assembly factor BamB family protein [Agreia pratensis]|uniref:PQQ-like domain-containing protein n=1 Tax=Agreia pratensis TaxID=150121 RepID=A0A1X7L2Z6_9MICO|nr:PQQ-binding-like beta-propeller repeat protein [Agreia pratensis]SMG48238.1 PQQ-like domain-containing protein [Agreia pratensis]
MSLQRSRRRWYILGAAIAVLGAATIAASIIWQWRHIPYGLGVAALALGGAIVVVVAVRRAVWRVVAGVAVAALVVTGGVVALTGISPNTLPHWDRRVFEGVSGLSARTGDLLISGGTAYDAASGDIVWSIDRGIIDPMLVRSDIVVLTTSDETIAVETSTGDELWRSTVFGRGIAANGNVLVVSHPVSDTEFEAIALDLTTGETIWQRPGRPVMECDLGPVDRYSVAPDRSHVILYNENSPAELLSVADGSTTIANVDCSVIARMVGDVLLETNGRRLSGRSPTDGSQLWSTPIDESWTVEGDGPEVFTPSEATGDSIELTAIDVASGRTRTAEPPAGKVRYVSSTDPYRSADVWVVVDLDAGAAMWNPGTDAFVAIPDAESIDDYGIDAYSGWIALSGRTRDFTGDVSRLCWALSPDGELFGPAPGPGCYVDEGIMDAGHAVYPLK